MCWGDKGINDDAGAAVVPESFQNDVALVSAKSD